MTLLDRTSDNTKHFTVTGYVVNHARTKMLLIWHRKLKHWLPPGGHLEPNEIPHLGAAREVFEETGVEADLVPAPHLDLKLTGTRDTQIPAPLALSYQLIPASATDAEHIHLDMLYMFEADEDAVIAPAVGEVADARWVTLAEIELLDDVFDATRAFAQEYLTHTSLSPVPSRNDADRQRSEAIRQELHSWAAASSRRRT